ncbi:YhcH/YjgK/YiaL family protein [Paenibacillus sp. CMAA1364]
MIVGSTKGWTEERQFAHPVLQQAIDFLVQTDFSTLEEGRYPISGDKMFALLMGITTKSKVEQNAEKHERFLDIHFLIQGEETIGWQWQDGNIEPSQTYNSEDDFVLFTELKNETMIKLTPGMFMVLFPGDIHRPGVTETIPSNVRKVVIKIDQSLF